MAGKPQIWTKEKFATKWRLSDTGCWIWTGGKYLNKYGRQCVNGKEILSHRLSWMLHKGDIADGLWVLHKCDNPECVNPEHLFLGTHKDNELDKMTKGRQMHGDNHYAAKLSSDIVKTIRESSEKGIELAKRYGVTPGLVSMIRSNKVWRAA